MALCLAMLAGIGFSFFAERRASVTYLFVSALVTLVVLLALAGWSLPRVIAHKDHAFVYFLNVSRGSSYRRRRNLIVRSLDFVRQQRAVDLGISRFFVA